jgi:acetyl-CoA carboxylase carboxyltransferase component
LAVGLVGLPSPRRRHRGSLSAEIDAASDPKAKLAEIEDRLNKLRSPFRTAETFWVEEIIDPRDTRKLLCEFANLAEPLRNPGPRTFPMRP